MRCSSKQGGFTLIELSIVLVIVGLIIGGVLVGQDLVSAAATRATIAQIEKYNSAVNTFVTKYGQLPGDMNQASAIAFNFPPYDVGPNSRGGTQGRGDGNGVLDSFTTSVISNPAGSLSGEVSMFWGDLSYANMIDGSFSADQHDAGCPNSCASITTTAIGTYLPPAKLGNGNYITVMGNSGQNYFLLFAMTGINGDGNGGYNLGSTLGLTEQQAYNMDKKIDDGLPQAGRVTAQYLANRGSFGWVGASPGASASGSVSTCYDNAGGTGTMQYSTEISNGSNPNCALSFRMQGAAR